MKGLMSDPNYDAFISYSHADKQFVLRLAEQLTSAGFRVFFDQTDIAIGDTLVSVIDKAVRSARFLLVVMSPNYFSSRWGAMELQLGLSEELDHNVLKVIPILRRECEIPAVLAGKLWADFRTDEQFADSFARLIAVLRGGRRGSVPVTSGTWQQAPTVGQVRGPLDASVAQAIKDSVNEAVRNLLSDVAPKSSVKQPDIPLVDQTRCFVVMPFGSEDLTVVYEDFVRPTITHCGLVCERGDDLFGSNVVMDDIQRSIETARLIVADLTGKNANVFYEVGIAHALRKPVLLLAQSMNEVPFDLRHRRVLLYEYSPRGCRKLENHLSESIKAMLSDV
jgi:hypothetical protein